MPERIEGPYLAVAVLCERVLEERDGVLSIVRIVDRLTTTIAGPDAPERMPANPVNLTLLVGLKSGFVRGRHDIEIKIVDPSGRTLGKMPIPVLFEGDEDRGVNLILPL